MAEFGISVNGVDEVNSRLTAAARQLHNRSVPNRAVATQFYSWFARNFNSQGKLVGGWPDLADATKARKAKLGKEQMLVISGHLRASFLPFSDNEQAGIGSEVPYSIYHDQGGAHLPQRRLLPNREEALEMGTKVYEFYVAKLTQEANR